MKVPLTAADFRGYRRLLVQDSTVIKLPAPLFPLFSGLFTNLFAL